MSKPKSDTIIALAVLGRHTYTVSGRGLAMLAPLDSGQPPQQALEEWLERSDRVPVRASIPIVWETTGDHAMTRDRIELPRLSRADFANLENVCQQFPAVAGGTHAWGFDPLPKGVGRTGRVLIHVETVPSLQIFGDTAVAKGILISSAWSLPTLIYNAFARGLGAKVLVAAPDFCAIYVVPNGGGPAKGILTAVDMKDPQAAHLIYNALESANFFVTEAAPKAWKLVGLKEDFSLLPPMLADADPDAAAFLDRAVTSAPYMMPWDVFVAEGAKHLSRGGEADLWGTFPQPFPLPTVLKRVSLGLACLACFLLALVPGSISEHRRLEKAFQADTTMLTSSLAAAKADRDTYMAIHNSGRDQVNQSVIPRGRGALLVALAEDTPEIYTITALSVQSDGHVEAEFFQVTDGDEEQTALLSMRNDLQRDGFEHCQIQLLQPNPSDAPVMGSKHHYQLLATFKANNL